MSILKIWQDLTANPNGVVIETFEKLNTLV